MEDQEISLNVNERNEGYTSTRKDSWVVEIRDEPKNSAIYRRPLNVREKQDSNFLYTPRIVSFGPYHHDNEYCQQTNKIKELVFLQCIESYGKRRDEYVDALREDVENLKGAYNKLQPKWEQDEDAFLQLMVIDGCFLLHILREENHLFHLSHEALAMYEISLNELIEYYKHDMLLLENQLPMLLIEKLLAVQNDSSIKKAQEDLYELILRFIAPSSPNNLLRQKGQQKCLHLLDLYRQSLLLYHDPHEGKSGSQTPLVARTTLAFVFKKWRASEMYFPRRMYILFPILLFTGLLFMLPILFIMFIAISSVSPIVSYLYTMYVLQPVRDVWFIIPSATELQKAGIPLDQMRSTKCLRSISFLPTVLRLRQIYVDGAAKSRLLNIIAFEQLHADAENVVTSYIYFMSRLLQAAGDVRLLQLRDIIRTTLHADEVVELFKSLTKDINVHDPNILMDKNCRDAVKRMSWCFHYKMGNPFELGFWQTFNVQNPWALTSIIAAIFLFGLTGVQTVYSVLSYYNYK